MNTDFFTSELNSFLLTLGADKNIETYLNNLKIIASRFTFLEEDQTLQGTFSVLLSLVEQYKRELLVDENDRLSKLGRSDETSRGSC